MSNAAPRAVMLGHLLRQHDLGRVARLLDRLDGAALAGCVEQLDPGELGVLADVALAPARVHRTATLPLVALVALVGVARDGDVRRLLASLPAGPVTRILLGLGRDRRRHIGRILASPSQPTSHPPSAARPHPAHLGAAFRQRRLFSAG